jgi:hypothetical protein
MSCFNELNSSDKLGPQSACHIVTQPLPQAQWK